MLKPAPISPRPLNLPLLTYKYALLRGVIKICQQVSHRSISRVLLVHTIIIGGFQENFHNYSKQTASTTKGNIFRVP